VRAGAETGWDFSSRWIRQEPIGTFNITNIRTNEIVQVELNSIMYRFELNMAYFAQLQSSWSKLAADAADAAGVTIDPASESNAKAQAQVEAEAEAEAEAQAATSLQQDAQQYTAAAAARSAAIDAFLWDSASKHWRDYNLTAQAQQDNVYVPGGGGGGRSSNGRSETGGEGGVVGGEWTKVPVEESAAVGSTGAGYQTIANWIPMWAGLQPADGTTSNELVASLQGSGLLQPGGVLTTNTYTGLQWDQPDAWAPLVMFTIEGLQTLNTNKANNLAVRILCVHFVVLCIPCFWFSLSAFAKFLFYWI
jgi:neutral trehalase